MRIDFADLRLFLAIVEAGSITGGAAQSHLALASASERLRRIETDAGVALLERHARGVAPTEAGAAFAHHARLLLQQHGVLDDELRGFAEGVRGTLHLYANTAALAGYLPRRLARWLADRPRLDVELKERTSTEIVALVSAGLAEAGIVSDAVPAPGMQLQPVAQDHLVLLVASGHWLPASAPVRFGDVLDESFVGLESGSALQAHVHEQARTLGRALSPRIRMKSFDGLCEMVAHGIGIAVLPRQAARRYRRRGDVRTVPLADAWARRRLALCYREWHRLSPAMRSLLLHLGAMPGAESQ